MKRLRLSWRPLVATLLLGLAAVLVLLALDTRAWQHRLTRDDLRFRALHGHVDLWSSPSVLPGDPARALLGLDDALQFRHTLQLFWYSRVGAAPDSQQDLPTLRIETNDQLAEILDGARTSSERSTAANLLGVLTVTTPVSDTATQTQTLQRAAEYFQQAISLDPTNYAAKLNLELVLRLRKPGKSRFGKDARGGYGFGKGRGVGVIGSGY